MADGGEIELYFFGWREIGPAAKKKLSWPAVLAVANQRRGISTVSLKFGP